MKNIISSVFLTCMAIAANAQSPVSLGKTVVTLPKAFEKPDERTSIYNTDDRTSLPWIVFSDRAENYTYTSPGGTLVMKKISFMQPFYVSEQKNGFIKLIKYDAGMVQGKKLTNKKASQSYGWISISKVLPWQSAFTSQNGYPSKYVTVISGKGPLTMPDFYYDKTDSAYIFTAPDLSQKKTKVALHSVVYVYKKSDDGKQVLVGSDPQLIADNAAGSVYGWIAADAVHSWGDRLYIGSAKENQPLTNDSVAAYINQSLKIKGDGSKNYFAFDPLLADDAPLLLSIPVSGSGSGNISLGFAADVYDKTHNSVLNIKGGHLAYKDYLQIRNNVHHINVVFVVDGGSPMRNYFSGITSTIQSFGEIFDEHTKGNKIRYGAVVYRNAAGCQVGGIQSSPLNADYRTLVKYLESQADATGKCSGVTTSQPVFDGIRTGIGLFGNHPDETNLIILVGTTGAIDHNSEGVSSVVSQITAANARLLAIQLFSDYNSIYNDFVIQARQMVSQSAVRLADYKKQRMVNGEGLTNVQQFNTSLSDSVSFYLDFPKKSLIQGAVVFPPKRVVKSNQAMSLAVDRLMRETDYDIRNQTHTLDSAFRLTGRENRYVQPLVMQQQGQPSTELGNNMPHNAFKYYLTADAPRDLVDKSQGKLQYLLILNEQDYKQLADLLSLMIGENLQQDASDYRSKLVDNYVDVATKRLGLNISGGDVRDMTLADYFQRVTSLPLPGKKDFYNKKVGDLKRTDNMPQAMFESYIRYLIHSSDVIKRAAITNQHFLSNGKTYYYITQANLQ
ncbi:type VI secretion system protein TssR domain-containing protein [Mucilaginibacter celer]|uniref:VWA domain-containing protein n=1 Tax=Mucilaginibacter celer TaxID=2305508 RepID=A0A494VMQ8_9SPHI|nr:type VI secretion system protein TssR domain-containing protein [Mucilaginibacter celer]AYL94961.1 VWA domain-containing protein [Mucilaginibacter celer]